MDICHCNPPVLDIQAVAFDVSIGNGRLRCTFELPGKSEHMSAHSVVAATESHVRSVLAGHDASHDFSHIEVIASLQDPLPS